MKRILALFALSLLVVLPLACQPQGGAVEAGDIETAEQRAAYAIGLNLGNNLRMQGGTDLDVDIIAQGLRDGLGENEPLVSVEDMEAAIAEMNEILAARGRELASAAGEENRAGTESVAAAFLYRLGFRHHAPGKSGERYREQRRVGKIGGIADMRLNPGIAP